MWKIFLNKLWNIFGAILAVAIILAAIVGGVYLIVVGGPVVIFIFAFLFVIGTCYIDARRKYYKNMDENKHMCLRFVRMRSDALLKGLEKYGYSLDAEHMLNLVNVTIKEYEDEYGTDECIQYQKDRINKMLELYKK